MREINIFFRNAAIYQLPAIGFRQIHYPFIRFSFREEKCFVIFLFMKFFCRIRINFKTAQADGRTDSRQNILRM